MFQLYQASGKLRCLLNSRQNLFKIRTLPRALWLYFETVVKEDIFDNP